MSVDVDTLVIPARRWHIRHGGVALALLAAAVLASSLRRVRVEGASMRPALEEGDLLLVGTRPLFRRVPRAGEVVAVRDPRQVERVLVKRVRAVDPRAGTLEVRGDAPAASTDSRQFGPVDGALVVGRVLRRYGPPGRGSTIGSDAEP